MPVIKQLTLWDVVDLVAHFIWVPELYRTYCNSIKEEYFKLVPEHMDEDETCLMCVWGALKSYYETQGTAEVPDRSRFEVYLRSYIRSVSFENEEEEIRVEERLFGDDPTMFILPNLFDEERRTLNYASGEELVKPFLLERAIANSLRKRVKEMENFMGCVDTEEAENLRKLAENASRIEAISAEVEIQPMAPDLTYFNESSEQRIVTSGVPFIDAGISGGQRYGEVNGLLGPTGSGKTTLGCQLFVGNVKAAFDDYDHGVEDRVCVYFTYEQSAYELQRTRILSNAFNISRDSLVKGVNPEKDFSRGSERKAYELGRAFGRQSEYDRYYGERDKFNRHGIVRNMSGVPDPGDDPKVAQMKQHKGHGGVNELVHELDYITGKRNQGVRAVFIDYLGLVIDRQYMDADEKARWAAMRSFGDEVRQKIAGAFNCTVWLLHQMSGAANARNPTTPLKHTDASGCKSIADNMANCVCLGNKDSAGVLYLTFSKTRNSSFERFEDQNIIVKHDTLFSRMEDVSDRYQPDKGNACFYSPSDLVCS